MRLTDKQDPYVSIHIHSSRDKSSGKRLEYPVVKFQGHPKKVWLDFSNYLIDCGYVNSTLIIKELMVKRNLWARRLSEMAEPEEKVV